MARNDDPLHPADLPDTDFVPLGLTPSATVLGGLDARFDGDAVVAAAEFAQQGGAGCQGIVRLEADDPYIEPW